MISHKLWLPIHFMTGTSWLLGPGLVMLWCGMPGKHVHVLSFWPMLCNCCQNGKENIFLFNDNLTHTHTTVYHDYMKHYKGTHVHPLVCHWDATGLGTKECRSLPCRPLHKKRKCCTRTVPFMKSSLLYNPAHMKHAPQFL